MESRKDSRNSVNIMESPFVFSRTETWSATMARRPQESERALAWCEKTVAKTTTKVNHHPGTGCIKTMCIVLTSQHCMGGPLSTSNI